MKNKNFFNRGQSVNQTILLNLASSTNRKMESGYIRLLDIKPELSGYLAEASRLLRKSPVPDDSSVHEMRVLLKKSRAALKLVSSQVDSEYNAKDIQSLKEAAGLMTQWRDTTVHRKTLRDLKKNYPRLFDKLREHEKIAAILRRKATEKESSPELNENIEAIESLLKKTGYRLRFTNMQNLDPNVLLKELEKTYLLVTGSFLECRNKPGEKKLHEFRKKVKEFLFQLHFFRQLNPGQIKYLEKKLESLTRSLGKINDIAQLVKALEYKYPNDFENPALDELVLRMREKQDRQLMKIWPAASKFFSPGRNLVNLLGYKVLVI
jgi:CHAD domain-containing protein